MARPSLVRSTIISYTRIGPPVDHEYAQALGGGHQFALKQGTQALRRTYIEPASAPDHLEADAPEGIWDALVAQAESAGFEVIRNRRGSENGYCDFSSKQIAVRPDVAPAQAVKTLIHELGHALLHSEELPKSREVAEVEVESVAYIVCDAIGLDSGDYSFAYVARWSDGSSDLLRDSADRAITCAKGILASLERPSKEG